MALWVAMLVVQSVGPPLWLSLKNYINHQVTVLKSHSCTLFLVLITKCWHVSTLRQDVSMGNILLVKHQHVNIVIVSTLAFSYIKYIHKDRGTDC